MANNEIYSEIVPMVESPLLWGYLQEVENQTWFQEHTQIREIVSNHLRKHNLQQPPTANIERKRKEHHKIWLMKSYLYT